ncbi:MAG: sigma-70 family RNA polymerase sigma factor [Candidatus Pseudobacter hemicellulosilyticus]|uniref:Sigma-70 family RNA polymerase sigma factor n=1 Tax=Candidatus Pseudobacter hemicellulosilyticus TaxID=3121375 RepID=A0AAJ5WV30_9BACT|nr:MAG: sigma-70 family RNA polymerase sigma factor [Pseudobacter sp.]
MPEEFSPQYTALIQQLKAIRANDDQALRHWYQSTYPAVEQYVLQNSGSTDEAKDIFQDAFLTAWRNIQLDRFQPESPSALTGYLFRIAQHKWLDHLRSARFRKTVPLEQELETPTASASDEEKLERIKTIKNYFKMLGDNCRELLRRFYYEKQSLRQVAEAMGWTEPTARNNKYRCVEKLRTMIKTNQTGREQQ